VEETKGNGEGDGIKQRADMGRSGAAPVHDVGWERQPQGMGATCCCQIGKNAGKMPALPRKSGKGVAPFPLLVVVVCFFDLVEIVLRRLRAVKAERSAPQR
jgi:hypothetical protein